MCRHNTRTVQELLGHRDVSTTIVQEWTNPAQAREPLRGTRRKVTIQRYAQLGV